MLINILIFTHFQKCTISDTSAIKMDSHGYLEEFIITTKARIIERQKEERKKEKIK